MRLDLIHGEENLANFLRILPILILVAGTPAVSGKPMHDTGHDPATGSLDGPGILRLSEKHRKMGAMLLT